MKTVKKIINIYLFSLLLALSVASAFAQSDQEDKKSPPKDRTPIVKVEDKEKNDREQQERQRREEEKRREQERNKKPQ